MKFMKVLILGFLISVISFTATSFASSVTQNQIKVKIYYRDLVQMLIQDMVPKGTYTVDVDVQMNEPALKRYFEDQELEVRLPMSRAFSGGANSKLRQEGPKNVTADDLAPFVTRRMIRIGLSETISQTVRNLIKDSVTKNLSLSVLQNDRVETYDLPKEFTDSWLQWARLGQQPIKKAAPEQPVEIPKVDYSELWTVGIVFTLICGMICTMFFLGIRTIGNRFAKEFNQSSNQAADRAFAEPIVAKKNEEQEKYEKSKAAITQDVVRVFEKLDLPMLKMICADAVSSSRFRYVPYSFLFYWLDHETSKLLDQELSDELKPFPGVEEETPSKLEVAQYLVENYALYKNLVKNDFALELSAVSVGGLIEFLKTLSALDSVVVVENLTPLKRQACVAGLPVQTRLEWAKISLKQLGAEKVAFLESKLIQQAKKFDFQSSADPMNSQMSGAVDGLFDRSAGRSNSNPLSFPQISASQKNLLQPRTFEEDEELYQATLSEPHLYEGFLDWVYSAEPSFWSSVDLRSLASVTFGYSYVVRETILSKLAPKRAEWYKGFIAFYEKTGMGFEHTVLKEVRKKLKNSTLPGQENQKSEHKRAA